MSGWLLVTFVVFGAFAATYVLGEWLARTTISRQPGGEDLPEIPRDERDIFRWPRRRSREDDDGHRSG